MKACPVVIQVGCECILENFCCNEDAPFADLGEDTASARVQSCAGFVMATAQVVSGRVGSCA